MTKFASPNSGRTADVGRRVRQKMGFRHATSARFDGQTSIFGAGLPILQEAIVDGVGASANASSFADVAVRANRACKSRRSCVAARRARLAPACFRKRHDAAKAPFFMSQTYGCIEKVVLMDLPGK